MAYLWNKTLETGYEEIDEQHKQLFDTLNGFVDAYHNNKGAESIIKTLEFLGKYTIMHFTTEEVLMKKSNYPEYNYHKQCHDTFKETVSDFTNQLNTEGSSEDLIVNISTAVGEWLITHIKVDDIKMTKFIKSCEM
ncbi:MAG: hemerythrin family protein [Treponema sp.]|nr:hemerythrin family protein [Treponema sp.]